MHRSAKARLLIRNLGTVTSFLLKDTMKIFRGNLLHIDVLGRIPIRKQNHQNGNISKHSQKQHNPHRYAKPLGAHNIFTRIQCIWHRIALHWNDARNEIFTVQLKCSFDKSHSEPLSYFIDMFPHLAFSKLLGDTSAVVSWNSPKSIGLLMRLLCTSS